MSSLNGSSPSASSENSDSLESTPRTTRRSASRYLTPQEKLTAIYRVQRGESKASVARTLSVPESTLRGWCKNQEKILHLSRKPAAQNCYNFDQQTPKLWTNEGAQKTFDEPLDYRKKVLDSQHPMQAMTPDLFNFHMERARMQAYPYPTGKPVGYRNLMGNASVDRILQEQWHHFLRYQLQQKAMEHQNYYWHRQFYINQQTRHFPAGNANIPNQFLLRGNENCQENSPETVNETDNNADKLEDTNSCLKQGIVQEEHDISDEVINENNTNNQDNEAIDQSAALKHGEKFLRWLESCGDPNVTAIHVLQFKKLLDQLNIDNEM